MQYAGITIGPIFDTIDEASSPAALWFASTMFSDITRRLCKSIKEKITGAEIYSPYFENSDTDRSVWLKDGVGKYHDRVIFSADSIDVETLEKLIADVKAATVEMFGKKFWEKADVESAKTFFEKYLMIVYVILNESDIQEENCLLAISPYLDALELMHFSTGGTGENPIRKLFEGETKNNEGDTNNNEGETKNKNKYVKDIVVDLLGENNSLIQGKEFRSIEDIAGVEEDTAGVKKDTAGEQLKHTNYFAVVSADGDGMGAFLKTLTDNEDVGKFSEACLKYDKEAAQIIVDFGGMPIYAGGDDLLFLAPVVRKHESGKNHTEEESKTILGLCKEINDLFKGKVKEKMKYENESLIPTISFGISIQYYKYPLYEALARAREQLDNAKNVESGGTKNRVSLILEKHSGQSIDFVIGNEHLEKFEEILMMPSDKMGLVLQSLGSKLALHEALVKVIDEQVKISKKPIKGSANYPWDNLFDNEGQKEVQDYLKAVQDWYYDDVILENWRFTTEKSGTILNAALRMSKFLIERGREDDETISGKNNAVRTIYVRYGTGK